MPAASPNADSPRWHSITVTSEAPAPKEILWLDTTNHIDLYDVPDYVDPAIDRLAEWLGAHL
ncbi:alpha/beta hydrolase [Ammonicoccus fulvus]|uniref:Alpha/beta hydrolase n=1 Tax=Ammonicoccus fulvus TaxID=3138240 RepID=A0ABZ3FWG7_9ACTN